MTSTPANSEVDYDDSNIETHALENLPQEKRVQKKLKTPQKRDKWGRDIEFLLSCIAMSVGLGNVWLFPFSALKNGGSSFVLPYIVVLLIVGKPIYLLEMVLGQFYSRGCVKAFDFAPAMRGVGMGQVLSIFTVATFYAPTMAITLRYLYSSFNPELPWSTCNPEWNVSCSNSSDSDDKISNNGTSSSAELYFLNEVIHSVSTISDGIGWPIPTLVIFLAISWILIFVVMIKGIKSSGKASYVLAIFPYVILIVLFVRSVTLPGASDGLRELFAPKWEAMLSPKVWFEAVNQMFFSLAVCFGCITMYSSYNNFEHNLYRDVHIVTMLDTVTSLLAGATIFGVLGHLKYKTGRDIFAETEGGSSLAFISYPDVISKFEHLPNLFAVLFFLMLFILGTGSVVAMISCVMTVIRDKFPKVKNWHAAFIVACFGFGIGLFYITPGGMKVVDLIVTFGVSYTVYIFAIAELVAVCWIYGVKRFCKDIDFMLGSTPSIYWRLCWNYITPLLMIAILINYMYNLQIIEMSKGVPYPTIFYIIGGSITIFYLLQLPIFAGLAIAKTEGSNFIERIKGAFQPTESWGPQDPVKKKMYDMCVSESEVIDDNTIARDIWYRVTKRNERELRPNTVY